MRATSPARERDLRIDAVMARFGLPDRVASQADAGGDPSWPGACVGPGRWRANDGVVESVNPANERSLGRVRLASAADLQAILASASDAARAWREVPAPQRGEAVRRFGQLLREHKDALGTLVALATTRVLASLLYRISPFDPVAYGFACGLLLGVACLANLVPALSAARIDPLRAVRAE